VKVEILLFGALRDLQPEPRLEVEMPDAASVAGLREVLKHHAQGHWPALPQGLLDRCAFASDTTVLRDGDALPPGSVVAVLPPVSGG